MRAEKDLVWKNSPSQFEKSQQNTQTQKENWNKRIFAQMLKTRFCPECSSKKKPGKIWEMQFPQAGFVLSWSIDRTPCIYAYRIISNKFFLFCLYIFENFQPIHACYLYELISSYLGSIILYCLLRCQFKLTVDIVTFELCVFFFTLFLSFMPKISAQLWSRQNYLLWQPLHCVVVEYADEFCFEFISIKLNW